MSPTTHPPLLVHLMCLTCFILSQIKDLSRYDISHRDNATWYRKMAGFVFTSQPSSHFSWLGFKRMQWGSDEKQTWPLISLELKYSDKLMASSKWGLHWLASLGKLHIIGGWLHFTTFFLCGCCRWLSRGSIIWNCFWSC